MPLHVHFVDLNPEVIEQLKVQFGPGSTAFGQHEVEFSFLVGDVRNFFADAFVSPANSFGYMDGGVDAAYSLMWSGIGRRVQKAIEQDTAYGELLVGDALCVPCHEDRSSPVLIVAPTMRLPRPIKNFDDIFLASRAAFDRAISSFGPARAHRVIVPGMGTHAGRVLPVAAASYMRRGWDDAWVRNQ